METLRTIDEFVMGAEDARIAWYTVARHFQLLSMRDWTDDAKLAKALGVRQATLAKSAAAFQQMISADATEEIRR